MQELLPLHALVLLSGAAADNEPAFPSHEYLSLGGIWHDLIGDRPSAAEAIVEDELLHRVQCKLSLGERVVVGIDDMAPELVHRLCALATDAAAPLYHLRGHGGSLLALPGSRLIPRGADRSVALPVRADAIQARYRGITVVGDVHGETAALDRAVTWARGRGHFIWFLGDVVDGGSDSMGTVSRVYDLVMAGQAGLLMGNHERKIARFLAAREAGCTGTVRLSEANRVTIRQLNRCGRAEQARWVARFRALLAHTDVMSWVGRATFAHAAVHPLIWSGGGDRAVVERFALYGETAPPEPGGGFRQGYGWVDAVPEWAIVIVGHDTRARLPLTVSGALGGQVVFLDTGCGHGGPLSTADLRFNAEGVLVLENFNQHAPT